MKMPCASAMRPVPTLHERPCRVENHDWWVATLEDVDAILRIHGDLADTRVSEVGWKLRPGSVHSIAPRAECDVDV